ncbi:MAG: sensor histidine kinase [Pikeienuella sp.]
MIGIVGFGLIGLRILADDKIVVAITGGSAFAAVGILLAPELMRFGASVRGVVWAALLTGLTGLAVVLSAEGPSVSPAAPLILLAPIVIALALNAQDAVRAGGLSIATIVVVFVLEGLGLTSGADMVAGRDMILKCAVLVSMLAVQTFILGRFAQKVRQTNRSLAKAHKAAEAANIAKSQFLATANHELRTPLNGVIGMAQIILTTQLSPKQRKMAEIMDSSAVSLLKMLNDVFDATEANSGLCPVSSAPFDVEDVIKAVVAAHEQQAWDKGLGLKLTIDHAARGNFAGDAMRIEQILTRLLENAIKFTETGVVLVRLCRSGKGETQFLISDAGPGLSAEDQEQIFDQFQQVDQSETRVFGGLGLGLATSRTLAEMMGGSLSVQSALGEGATFTLSLPLRRAYDRALKEKLAG